MDSTQVTAVLLLLVGGIGALTQFKGAVIEHKVISKAVQSSDEAEQVMMSNLDILENSIKEASRQGVNLLVFPEYGITGDMDPALGGRPTIYPYALYIPKPGTTLEEIRGLTTPTNHVLFRLSLMAHLYDMYIVANLVERVDCHPNADPRCPKDAHYQYNTNIVYAKNGTLVAKYHKMHMWAEEKERIDHPSQLEYTYFDTEFGRVGTFICFDAMFQEPAAGLIEKYQVDHIVFPTYWNAEHGYMFSNVVQITGGLARRYGVNFLAANIHDNTTYTYGSELASSKEVLNATCDTGAFIKDKLLTATLDAAPRILEKTPPSDICTDLSYPEGESYFINIQEYKMNVTRLQGKSGKTSTCFKKLCCSVDYERNNTDEHFVLAVFSGLMYPSYNYSVELCMVSHCPSADFSSCDLRTNIKSQTTFKRFSMHGVFHSNYVYPSVTGSHYTYSGIIWNFHHHGKCNMITANKLSVPFLTATLFGVVEV